ncbi:hypothetical protein AXK11_09030 [Cephaloticoccus primus]|uniref:Uncharacterized protein n=1 Tax=Cephaloticoccus primus TaxID=1548207 RepID=A0A139SHU9_9BACT|nr:hypothetical protein [Cephaloticoccus primus]KXU34064.1 hypothetical protein AXK11_09030 [Cephaloticoccus primus]
MPPTATIELPEEVYTLAEQTARARHVGLSDFVAKAVCAQADPPWLATFGELADMHDENVRVMERIDKAFGQIEPEAWR